MPRFLPFYAYEFCTFRHSLFNQTYFAEKVQYETAIKQENVLDTQAAVSLISFRKQLS